MQFRNQAGWALLAVSALVALAACTNTTNTGANDPSGGTRVANTTNDSNAHSVGTVSDALGQRLDNMLSSHQGGTSH